MNEGENKHEYGKLLKQSEVIEYLNISKSNWHDGVRSGNYPQPVRIGTKTTRWFPQDIDDYLRRKQSDSDADKRWSLGNLVFPAESRCYAYAG